MDSSLKFNSADFTGQDIAGLPDVPSAAGMTAAQLKARFDNIGKVMIALGKHNALVDALSDSSGASGIGAVYGGAATTVQDALDSLYTQGMNTLYMIAEPFFPYDSYSAGNIVWYDGKLYLFTSDHTGEWDGADAEEISVSGMLQEHEGEISDLQALGLSVVNNQICITY